MGLDLAGLQHQCLEFALAHHHIEFKRMGDHLRNLGIVGNALAEILRHPHPQTLGFADVNDLLLFIAYNINARQHGQHTGFFVQFCFGHTAPPFSVLPP